MGSLKVDELDDGHRRVLQTFGGRVADGDRKALFSGKGRDNRQKEDNERSDNHHGKPPDPDKYRRRRNKRFLPPDGYDENGSLAAEKEALRYRKRRGPLSPPSILAHYEHI
jgi:hypothetical protein